MSQKLTVVEVIPQKEPKLPKVKEQEKKEPVKDDMPEKAPVVKETIDKSAELQALRQSFRPVDFNFDPLFDDMEAYLAQLDDTTKAQEEKVIQEVSDFRDQMIIDLFRHEFIGNVYLKDKKPLRAAIVKVGNDTLLLQLKSGKQVSVKWSSLRFEQFEEFVTYFAFHQVEDFQLGVDMQESCNKVSAKFHQLAVFLQWYGREKDSATAMKKARTFRL
ncbi:MAG: hypothetical protein HRT88_21450 [Lentisphaeraceae bacterium]|nr:hypothetical protein [Lentisphaeraceae bacterium]